MPLYEPAGTGDHTWLWIEKCGISTMAAVAAMAEVLGLREREIGYAGLKDARAVTRQWLSIEHLEEARVPSLETDRVKVLRVARHGNKLKVGHLRGNRFDILLRGCTDADGVRANLEHMARVGAPNFFGEQRFGKRGANLDKGMRILHGNPKKAARAIPKRLLRLLVSAVQSEVFNRVLLRRLPTMERMQEGDVAYIHDKGACFLCEDPGAEQPRADAFEISPSGPLPGPKALEAKGEPGRIEAEVMAGLEIEPEIFGRIPHGTTPGDRRPLRVPVWEPEVETEGDGVRLRFGLPKGSFATSVLRELLEESPWFGAEGAVGA